LNESGDFGEADIDIDANLWPEDGNEIPKTMKRRREIRKTVRLPIMVLFRRASFMNGVVVA
jgi:hypothetical protein